MKMKQLVVLIAGLALATVMVEAKGGGQCKAGGGQGQCGKAAQGQCEKAKDCDQTCKKDGSQQCKKDGSQKKAQQCDRTGCTK